MKAESYLCISAFFTFWGDRMWQFATGIFLIQLTPESLRLAATYGLCLSLIAIIFSPMIGDWVDRTARLEVIQLLLLIQNSLVVVCAITIYLCMRYKTGNLQLFLQALIILLGSAANLASQGQKIAIGKDWIVVVCKQDKDLLAHTNALLRRIDLTVAILAPLVVGFLMSGISTLAGIIFICVWNVLSLFFEYGFLLKVYNLTPDLSVKNNTKKPKNNPDDDNHAAKTEDAKSNQVEEIQVAVTNANKETSSWNLIKRVQLVISGWHIYYRQTVFLAGCSLSMLYLTVIGFSAITTGFAYELGLSELYVSICMGLGSLFGVFGTLLFPKIRNRLGLVKSGIVGFLLQLSMLVFCVVSIWMPGSPSNLYNGKQFIISALPATNMTALNTTSGNHTGPTLQPTVTPKPQRILTSIIFLMTGIILSRTGLWLSDLTITQLQQEYVSESERGIVGGVQYSSNCLLDLVHFLLTISLPKPDQFGILILISFCAIGCAGFIYLVFVSRFHSSVKQDANKYKTMED
ncbi:ferroportin-like [Clytia hemisphaerica]|uniref:Solute carrier family 40 member n=1 Tax=Clytia hemisphaerica TaxID=252671 RepID=A0A7M5WRI9_9CNID